MLIWWRLVRLFHPYKRQLFFTFLATVTRPILNAGKIYVLKIIVDNLVKNPTGSLVLWICLTYLAISLIKGIANYVDQWMGAVIGGKITLELRRQVFARFTQLGIGYHAEHRTGEQISRLISDVGAIEDMLVSSVTDGITQVLTIILFSGMLFYLDPALAGISLVVMPFLFLSLIIYGRQSRDAFRAVRVRLSEMTAMSEESLSTVQLTKTFLRHDHELQRFTDRGEAHRLSRLRATRIRAIFLPLSDVVATMGTVLIVYFGAQALANGTLTIGGLVIFLAYLGQMYNPLLSLSRLGNSMQGGIAAAERVLAILDLPADADDPSEPLIPWRVLPKAAENKAPAIKFTDVTAGYTPGEAIVENLSFVIPHGSFTVIVGESGSGKTTALLLVQRLLEAWNGQITLFGHDLREYSTHQVRSLMAITTQEALARTGTARDNIRYGNLQATQEQIDWSAMITGFPMDRIDEEIGSRGIKLSGGQRQRMAIARAFVRNAPLVILDEATSALDPIAEAQLQRVILQLRGHQTIVAVAHRLALARYADQIIVFEHGTVVEVGNHETLLARNGHYARMINANVRAVADSPTMQMPKISRMQFSS